MEIFIGIVILIVLLLIKVAEANSSHETKTTRKRAYGVERLFTPFGSRYYAVHKRVPKKGWWQASDGKWYPPHQHPNYRPPPAPPPK